MVGGVHVDMDAAGVVDLPSGMTHLPHTFLKFRQLIISQLGGDHFHPVVPIPSPRIAVRCLSFPLDTGVAHQFPFFIFCVPDNPCAIGATFVPGRSPEVICQSDGSLFSCDAGELHLHAEALVLHIDHAASSRPSASSTARSRRPMASITWTVTLFPACLYACASELMARILSIWLSSNPCSRRHSLGIRRRMRPPRSTMPWSAAISWATRFPTRPARVLLPGYARSTESPIKACWYPFFVPSLTSNTPDRSAR